MIRIFEHLNEIKELRKIIAKQYKIDVYDYKYPLYYMDDDMIKVCGLLDVKKRRNEFFKTGEFTFPQPNGHTICFSNVVEYYVFLKQKNGEFKYIHSREILELSEMEDIYFLILRIQNNTRKVILDQEDLYEISLYHNDDLIFQKDNVYRTIHKRNNMNLIFSTKDIEKNQYNYWVYKNNQLIYMGCGQEKDAWKAALKGINSYEKLKTYKTSSEYIDIYFYADMSDYYHISYEFAKQTADKLEIIKNLFDDDDSVNYVARYKKDRINEISMAHGIIAPKGTCLYGHVIDDIIKGLEGSSIHNQFEEFSAYGAGNNEYYKTLIHDLYKKLKIKENFEEIPVIVSNYLISASKQAEYLNYYISKNHHAYIIANEALNYNKVQGELGEKINYSLLADAAKQDRKLLEEHWKSIKEKRNHIFSQLVNEGYITKKWKNEILMFRLIKEKYDDALYQYNTKWLGRQTLDVFVPSIRVAFEYQGVQHYEPVEIFGGIENHLKQKELDVKKKKLCEKNDVRLIEWKYDEPVNVVQLRLKLELL